MRSQGWLWDLPSLITISEKRFPIPSLFKQVGDKREKNMQLYRHLLFVVFIVTHFASGTSSLGETRIQFSRDILPILSNHCFTCHGPDQQSRQSGLRLDLRSAAVLEGDSGELAIVPGKPELSEVYQRIISDDEDIRMPPSEDAHRLSNEQIDLIKEWILNGAQYENHWAFIPPKRPTVPIVAKKLWVKNPIDNFVLRRLGDNTQIPSAEASRETLIRRVCFDLTGIPPTLEEQTLFLTDHEPDAYERMVDRYLQSPLYGEHLGRYWLDLARYADTNGYQYDTEREQWAWRDWVIDAYNNNMPFDQFTIHQLAGDLLPDATDMQRLATGFNRNHGITIEGGIIDEEYRTEYVMDRVVTTGSVWLGMTVGCARCHDHKYDPLSQEEFYQLFALFNQVPERGMRGFSPQEKIHSPIPNPKAFHLTKQIDELKKQLAQPINLDKSVENWSASVRTSGPVHWEVVEAEHFKSTGGSSFSELEDQSLLVGGANPNQDNYTIISRTDCVDATAVRLEALTHESLPGGGPGRHSNSNFVLSEFELEVISIKNPDKRSKVKFKQALAEYSQSGYDIAKTIDGTVDNNNGWAVDGPTRKQPVQAIWVADQPFGYEGGTSLKFVLKHQANFATHGIGRPRLSITADKRDQYTFTNLPSEVIALTRIPFQQLPPNDRAFLKAFYLENHNPHESIRAEIQNKQDQIAALTPATMVMADSSQKRVTHLLKRGAYDQPAQIVEPGVPSSVDTHSPSKVTNRLDFANWLVEPHHPLTARVVVNRHWRRLFGRGLVETAEDFGIQGDLPTHPDLLDWLATELIDKQWDIKYLQRKILTSATYRQSSIATPKDYRADPDNRWLSRGPRFRLDGEQIRDAALAASGLLQSQLGGKSVYPYQPKGLWLELNNRPGYSKAYPQGSGSDLVRRSIYSFWKRTVPSPMLKTLDAPEREFCTVRRSRTNTPLQALLMLNGPQFMEASVFLGARMMLECDGDVKDKIAYGFRLVTSRDPSMQETAILLEEYNESFNNHEHVEKVNPQIGGVSHELNNLSLDEGELSAYSSVARIIFNLDEFITKG